MSNVPAIRLQHDAPDGMCIYAGCQHQAEAKVSWLISKGRVEAPLCMTHMRLAWEKTVSGHMSRETFTISPLG